MYFFNRRWIPPVYYRYLYENIEFPEPEIFHDSYENRSNAAKMAEMRIDDDLQEEDVKGARDNNTF